MRKSISLWFCFAFDVCLGEFYFPVSSEVNLQVSVTKTYQIVDDGILKTRS